MNTQAPSELDVEIVVEVLDEQFKLVEFGFEKVPEFMFEVELGGFVDPIGQLISWLYGEIVDELGWLWGQIEGLLRSIRDFLYTHIVDAVTRLVSPIMPLITTIGDLIAKIPDALDWLKEQALKIPDLLRELREWFQKQLEYEIQIARRELGADFEKGIEQLGKDVEKHIKVLEDPVVGIGEFVEKIREVLDKIWEFISDPKKFLETLKSVFWSAAETVVPWVIDTAKRLGGAIINTLKSAGETILGIIMDLIGGFIEYAIRVAGVSMRHFKMAYDKLVFDPTKAGFASLMKLADEAGPGGRVDPFLAMMAVFSHLAMAMIGTKMFAGTLIHLGGAIRELRMPFVGFMPGVFLIEIGRETTRVARELVRAFAYGYAIWLSRPYARVMAYMVRNMMPMEIPPLAELVEVTRRHIPTAEFMNVLGRMRTWLGLYGFSDEIVEWYTTLWGVRPVEVMDRFGRAVRIPRALLYDIPTGTELCRMMVRDIFGPVETPFPSFEKAIAMRGFTSDIAKLYYLLHFRYPGMDRLFQFICRVSAGFGWVTARAAPEAGLGFEGPSPKELSDRYKADPLRSVRELTTFLVPYSKWHDYAPFAWVRNFTADRLIVLDLMADIPMRIDARWMYKWMVISDNELMRIVVGRGMHPDWVERIAVAEAMNALAEERTYARTGLVSAFKEGFVTEGDLTRVLGRLTTVRILDRDRIVRFLPSEIKLLGLRAKYDRSIDILREYFGDLRSSVADNIMLYGDMRVALRTAIGKLRETLGIVLELDETYMEQYKPVVETLHVIYTTRRLRIWLRYMMFRILTRFAEGYITKEEMYGFVESLVARGKLTDEERKLLVEVAEFMYNYFLRETRARAVLRKLTRGAIKEQKALEELMKIGIEREAAEALIEQYAKIHTISVDKLVGMMEYIPVPDAFLKEKMDVVGIPPEEQKLYVPFAVVKELSEELRAYTREVMKDYVEGLITLDMLRQELNGIAALWGYARRLWGVDWVLWSPEERELLIAVAERRRRRKLAKEGR